MSLQDEGKDRLLDFANRRSSTAPDQPQQSPARADSPAQGEEQETRSSDRLLDFAKGRVEQPDFSPRLQTAERSTLQVHPPPENDPTQDEGLKEHQRIALDLAMTAIQHSTNTSAGYIPQSQLFSMRNSYMQGLGDFLAGIGTFASAAWREATFSKHFAAARGEELEDIQDTPLYKAGQRLKESVEEVFPENPEFQEKMATQLARTAGTLSGQVGAAAMTGGAAVASTGLMTASFSGMEYERALEATGDENKAFQTLLLNLPINSFQAIPVLQAMTRLNKFTGGGLANTIKGAGTIGTMEAVVETGQTAASNWVASEIYDETRELADGVKEGGIIGFILGGALGGSSMALRSRANDPKVPITERQEASVAHRMAKGELEKLDMTEQYFRRTFPETMTIKDPVADFANSHRVPEYDITVGEIAVGGSSRSLIPSPREKGFWAKWKPWFQDKGDFSPEIRNILRDSENLGDLFRADIRYYANQMKTSLKSTYNIKGNPFRSSEIPAKDMKAMTDYMNGEGRLDSVPESLREPLKDMRLHIDRMSDASLKIGLWEGEARSAVENNKGLYMYRTYKKHEYPDDWSKRVPAETRNQAKNWIRKQYEGEGYMTTDAQLDEMVRVLLLADDSPISILAGDSGVRQRVSDLKARSQFKLRHPDKPRKIIKTYDEVPKPIQELWGVETNPFIGYLNSTSKLASLIQNHKTLADMRVRLGEGSDTQLFFDPTRTDAQTKTELDLRELSRADDPAFAPLDGMWTTPEVKDALIRMNEGSAVQNRAYRMFLKGNSAAKLGATVLSPRTFVRNFIGSYLFLPAQGHIRTTDNKAAMDATLAIFRNPKSPEGREVLREMSRLGLMERSPKAGEMKALINDFKGVDQYDADIVNDILRGKGSGIRGLIEKGVMTASDAYQLGDTFFRVQLFNLEKARYQRKGVEVTDGQIAEIVHNIYQDYSRTPASIKTLRRNPLLAPFVTFHYEVVRTSANTVRQAKHEILSDDPNIRSVGYERALGFGLFAGLGSATTAAVGQMMLGITDGEFEALREWSSPWNKDATLMPVDVYPGGGRYVNLTYTDPYEIVKEPIYSFYRNFNEEEFHNNVLRSTLKFLEPAMSPELFAKASTEAFLGRTIDGRPIVHAGDSFLDRTMSRVAHVWDSVEPGVVKQGGEAYEAMGDDDPWSKVEALSALLGQRIVHVNAEEQMPYAIRDYHRRNRELRSSYLRTAREGTFSQNIKELDRVNREKKKNFDDMSKKMEAAFRLGLDFRDIETVMNENGMSKDEIRNIWLGRFEPFDRHLPD